MKTWLTYAVMKRSFPALVFLICFALGFGFFQNCASRSMSAADNGVTGVPEDHPPLVPSDLQNKYGSTRVPLMDLSQVTEQMAQAFMGEDEAAKVSVRDIINSELWPVQHALGGICELALTGSLQACNNNRGFLNNKLNASTSSVREAARIQMCLHLTADTTVMTALINRIKGSSSAPELESLSQLVAQFYPELEATSLVTDLLELDRTMSEGGESEFNRWGHLTQLLCESPAWQVL